MMSGEKTDFVSGYAAIIGKPNVGKSTLLNTLLATKISAVTHKPQTTRKKIVAIYTDDACQIIFIDTPGIFEPNYELQRIMVRIAFHTMSEAEVILYMIDTQNHELDPYVLDSLKKLDKQTILIINKIDLVNKNSLLPLIDEANSTFPFKEIIPISALKGMNTDAIIPAIRSSLPSAPPLYPVDNLSSLPERFFVADAIREQIFLQYGKEIPYATAVYIEEFREAQDQKKDYIRAIIFVERDSQKKILIGKKGDAVKKLGIAARKSIELFLGRPVFLELFVKTKKKWRENAAVLRSIGYLS